MDAAENKTRGMINRTGVQQGTSREEPLDEYPEVRYQLHGTCSMLKENRMQQRQKKFVSSPKKYHPRGCTLLYEDHDILVVDKTEGLLTVSTDRIREQTAYYRVTSYVRKGNQKSKNRVWIVHRLDRETSGILIFAKSEKAKRYLQDEWQGFSKKYYAVVRGIVPKQKGIITSYLTENRMHRVYSIKDPQKGKLAKTGYTVLGASKRYTLLEIDLFTGRKNQIRVHLSEHGFPVAGDTKYGEHEKGMKRLALHAASLTFLHPTTHEQMTFETPIPAYFNLLTK